jgi:O-methyltransferase
MDIVENPRFGRGPDPRQLYIDMVKRCVLNIHYVDAELNPIQPHGQVRKAVLGVLRNIGIQLAHVRRGDYERRLAGLDFSDIAHSMLSLKRLDNVQMCIETVLREQIPGDLIETGVMRGGTVILMRAILKVHGVIDRVVWAADSFEGLPPPNSSKYPADAGAAWHLRPLTEVGVAHVKRNFERYGLFDDQVTFLPGWFRNTLPTAPIGSLAILRLDGDLYESTMDALVPLYPKLSPGGFIIIDDYNLPMCRQAVSDYRQQMGITDEIVPIDDAGIYWRKAGTAVPTAKTHGCTSSEPTR